MLFVLAMDVLNRFLAWVEDSGYLTPVIGLTGPRVSLYADDLVLFVVPNESDLLAITAALQIFGLASGLFSNLDKSVATPIHCSDEDVQRIQDLLACRMEGFPTRYLGIPLLVRRLKRSDEQAIVDKVAARIPGWKGNLLNSAGRTALVKATLSAIPMHTMIGLGLSRWAVKSIDKLRRAFIWTGSDEAGGGKCKVSWVNVCRPKELGGLGISDLTKVGVARRVRWVWRDRGRGIASVADERPVMALFSAATVISLGNGESTLFWIDRWINGSSVQDLAPTLYNAVRPRKKRATVGMGASRCWPNLSAATCRVRSALRQTSTCATAAAAGHLSLEFDSGQGVLRCVRL